MVYIIWHDNDYDFAKWVYENSMLKDEEVILKSVPKTNESNLLKEKFSEETDYDILPIIKLATSDIIIQKVEKGNSKILFVSEFMTHTPQHDHVFQRVERIYNVSKEKIPVAFILPRNKVKFEKGTRDSYKEVKYGPNPLAVHTYLKTTIINQNATLMFFWPDREGYLKYDSKHQTAPKNEDQIAKWFDFLNESITKEDFKQIYKSKIVKEQLQFLEENFPLGKNKFFSVEYKDFISKFQEYYNLERVHIVSTKEAIKTYNLDTSKLSDEFMKRDQSLIFEYKSKKFRTDPYCGFVCGFTNLFCLDKDNKKRINFIHVPTGIKFKDVSKKTKKTFPCFSKIDDPLDKCPIHSQENIKSKSIKEIKDHLEKCIYTKSKQQRIFGTVPDIIIFEDMVYYNENGKRI